jgi:hypothetical protein
MMKLKEDKENYANKYQKYKSIAADLKERK